VNDFEKPVFLAHPGLKKIKEQLYHAGAVYASMTGSGSAFYGIFPRDTGLTLPDASLFPSHFFSIV
jgi:4-diphosphocytidyl-2-C-methyl-D-erythritol kinase